MIQILVFIRLSTVNGKVFLINERFLNGRGVKVEATLCVLSVTDKPQSGLPIYIICGHQIPRCPV